MCSYESYDKYNGLPGLVRSEVHPDHLEEVISQYEKLGAQQKRADQRKAWIHAALLHLSALDVFLLTFGLKTFGTQAGLLRCLALCFF